MYEDDYRDIINLPRPDFPGHAKMTMINRAAQFSSFAALSGYEDAVRETARLTCSKTELSEEEKAGLDRRLQFLRDNPGKITVTFFIPDKLKSGGEYVTKSCDVKRVDEYEKIILTTENEKIPVENIIAIDCPDYPD